MRVAPTGIPVGATRMRRHAPRTCLVKRPRRAAEAYFVKKRGMMSNAIYSARIDMPRPTMNRIG